ncbi:MAG: hypothetical protein KAR42_14740 [candidate division Zixibacteria bacterium]|nr:hypothetical protein [candidate division Zixibacteria bacterium]
MELFKVIKSESSNSHSEIYKDCGEFEVFNMINADTLSRSMPPKKYKTIKGATKYANKFMGVK